MAILIRINILPTIHPPSVINETIECIYHDVHVNVAANLPGNKGTMGMNKKNAYYYHVNNDALCVCVCVCMQITHQEKACDAQCKT